MATPASAELFERHHLAIFRYLLRTTGSVEVAEDLTQEVFVRVVKGLDTYQERDQERAWLFRIARNLRCDYTRRALRRPVPSSLGEVDVTHSARQDLQLSLSEALAHLNDDDREAFVLAEISGFSYADVAAICGSSVPAIRSRIYRARVALRNALSPESFERPFVRGTHG